MPEAEGHYKSPFPCEVEIHVLNGIFALFWFTLSLSSSEGGGGLFRRRRKRSEVDHPNTQYPLPKPIFPYLSNPMTNPLFNLNRAPSKKGKGDKAPHKPVLLLALIQEVEEGRITDNKVLITPELLLARSIIFKELVRTLRLVRQL
ncbi:MAG: hypothetical protein WBG42_06985 [Cryomorphaceae bacterium]